MVREWVGCVCVIGGDGWASFRRGRFFGFWLVGHVRYGDEQARRKRNESEFILI